MLAGRSPSVAVLVTVSVVSSLIVRLVWPVSSGAVFTSLTVTVKELVALRAGVPLSVTLVVNVFVLGTCASLGVQLIGLDIGWQVTIGGGVGERLRGQLIDRPVGLACQQRRGVHFVDRHGEGVGRAQGRRAVVRHDGRERVRAGPLALAWRPIDHAAGADAGSRWWRDQL